MSLHIFSKLTEAEKKQVQEKVVKALSIYENCIGGLMHDRHPPITQQFTVNIGASSQDGVVNSKTENHLIKKEEAWQFVQRMTDAINGLPEMNRLIILNAYVRKQTNLDILQILRIKFNFYQSERSFSRIKRRALFDLACRLNYVDEQKYIPLEEIETAGL